MTAIEAGSGTENLCEQESFYNKHRIIKRPLSGRKTFSQTGYSYKQGAMNGPLAADALSLCQIRTSEAREQ